MDWIQTITIILTIIGTVVAAAGYIHSDVKDLRQEMQRQAARTDRLYEMFIDLLKNKNTP